MNNEVQILNKNIESFKNWFESTFNEKVEFKHTENETNYIFNNSSSFYLNDSNELVQIHTDSYLPTLQESELVINKLIELDLNKKIEFFNYSFTKKTNHLIKKFPKLSAVNIFILKNENIDISFLSKKTNVSIYSGQENKSFLDLAYIQFPPELKSLTIADTIKYNENFVAPKINKLTTLDYIDNAQSSRILTTFKDIKELNIMLRSNPDTDLDYDISQAKDLELVDIISINDVQKKTKGINVIINNPKLKYASLIGVNIIYKSVCHKLTDFHAQGCTFEDNSLLALINSNTLSSLTIENADLTLTPNEIKNDSIRRLSLTNCNIHDIEFIKHINQVEAIDFSCNPIDKIPENIPESVTSIDISSCNIVNIPKYLIEKFTLKLNDLESKADSIFVAHNPIENPPLEIITQGKNAINEYYDSMEGETTTLNEAKIIFVGDGAVGKTSLMKRLVNNSFCEQEEQTDGIEIEYISIDTEDGDDIHASIWDFGGQQILQATHQLFLSKRSVYVLVVEDRKNDQHKDQDLEQWLTQINSLGGEPSILVVKNKIDENPHSDIQSNKLKEKFPNIVGFYEVSCKCCKGIDKLKKALSDVIINLPMRKIELPKNWLHVKNELKSQAEKNDLLYLNTYQEICTNFDITSKLAKDTLLKMLHDLGAVIAFEELASHNTAILNPHWITEGIYALLRSNTLAENNGVIDRNSAQKALDEYSEHNRFEGKAQYIIDAMKTFDLCHLTNESDQYLIPILLPPQIDFNKSAYTSHGVKNLRFIFKFENLLPPSLLPMLLVKVHDKIQGNRRWRTGAIISPTAINANAIIDADLVLREIHITIIGDDKRDLFVTLRTTIKEIISRITDPSKIGLKELIPLSDTNERVGYDELIGLKNMGASSYQSGKLGRSFPISELLGEIEPPEDTEKALRTLLKSNSHSSLLSINMSQSNQQNQQNTNQATGGNATNTVSSAQTQDQVAVATATATATASSEIKMELRAFKGQSEFVIEDIEEAIDDLTSSDRVLKDNAKRECEKVSKAVESLESSVEDQETADQNLRHFSRVQNFLEGALQKANSVGRVIDSAGNLYSQVETLAQKYNDIATKFAMPLVTLAGLS